MNLREKRSNYKKLSSQKIKKWNNLAAHSRYKGLPMLLIRGRWYAWEEGDRKSVFATDKRGHEYEFNYEDIEDIEESVVKENKMNIFIFRIFF